MQMATPGTARTTVRIFQVLAVGRQAAQIREERRRRHGNEASVAVNVHPRALNATLTSSFVARV